MYQHKTALQQGAGGILEPLELGEFFKDYWEQKPLHIARDNSNPFKDLVSISAIETILSTNHINYPTVQLSHAGKSIPVEEYTDSNGQIVSNRIIERYHAGSTIVISFAHRLHSNLMSLCRDVEKSLMMRCQTNVYLSPAANQGFNPHFDTHDVFILQVSGRKTFNFYSSGTSFPTSADRFNRDIHAIGEKTEEIQLSAGHTLYIPRGVVHDAVADIEEPSLHVTLGVYPVLLHALVDEVVQIALESDSRMRRAIFQPLWLQNENSTLTIDLIKEVLQEHVNESVIENALQRLRDEFVLEAVQNCQGALSGDVLKELSTDSPLRINRDNILRIDDSGTQLTVMCFGQIAEFSEPLSAAVQWLLQKDTVTMQEIPGLDPEQQLALVKRLQLLGIVRI